MSENYNLLAVIEKFMLENNVPPSIRELCKLCGRKSSSTMHKEVSALKKQGLVTCTSHGVVSLRIQYRRCTRVV